MRLHKYYGIVLAGLCAGAVNGLFGAGGGMVLIPLLTWLSDLCEDEIFPTSVSIILPVCLVSIGFSLTRSSFDWRATWPYLAGSAFGGVAAGIIGKKIPTKWLHKGLGILILWGGFRYLC